MPKKKEPKVKNLIVSPEVYREMLKIYGKHSKIPYHYKIKVDGEKEKGEKR